MTCKDKSNLPTQGFRGLIEAEWNIGSPDRISLDSDRAADSMGLMRPRHPGLDGERISDGPTKLYMRTRVVQGYPFRTVFESGAGIGYNHPTGRAARIVIFNPIVTMTQSEFPRSLVPFVLCLAVLFGLPGCSTRTPEAEVHQPDFMNGMALYKGQCAQCHDAGKRNAPSIKEAEEWDFQSLNTPGIVQRHVAMSLLKTYGERANLSEYDEIDVLYYIRKEIADTENY